MSGLVHRFGNALIANVRLGRVQQSVNTMLTAVAVRLEFDILPRVCMMLFSLPIGYRWTRVFLSREVEGPALGSLGNQVVQ